MNEARAGGRLGHVCLVARSCHPDKGSEPGKSWAWIRALARRGFTLTVVTEDFEDSASRIREEASANPEISDVRWVFVPYRSERLVRLFPLNRLLYRLWHRDVRRHVERLLKSSQAGPPVDLVHLLSSMEFRGYGELHRFQVPCVWGPIGGATPFPLGAFRPALGLKGRLYYRLFNVYNELWFRVSPGLRKTLGRAEVVSATTDMQERLRQHHGVDSNRIPDVGVERVIEPSRDYRQEPIRIAWSGLHIERKGFPLLIEAVARLAPDLRDCVRVEVLGDGPRRSAWERHARGRDVSSSFRFRGWLPRSEAVEVMADCHLLCVTSLRDATSTVLVEAMGRGVPVAAMDHCGFGDALGNCEAYRIDATGWSTAVDGFRETLTDAIRNPDRLEVMEASVLQRAREITYERLAERMTRVYREAVAP